jgi:transcriptional regulator with XRE-family HTH domain
MFMDRDQNCSVLPTGRLRDLCVVRGWDLGELARRAGVSRTTLYQLDRRRIRRPHSGTLGRIAAALGIPPSALWTEEAGASPQPALHVSAAEAFDRATNPAVAAVAAEQPGLFDRWKANDWAELYSTFGVGGELTPEGVVATAEAMNRKREVVQQLQVVLETHLADVAANVVATLYGMVRVSPADRTTPERNAET